VAKHDESVGDHAWKKNWVDGEMPESHFETVHQLEKLGMHMPVLHAREEDNIGEQGREKKREKGTPQGLGRGEVELLYPIIPVSPARQEEKKEEEEEEGLVLDVVTQWRLKRGYGVKLKRSLKM